MDFLSMSEGCAKVGTGIPDNREMARMVTATADETVDVLTVEEAHALFERRSIERMGLSRVDFLDALEHGTFSDRTDETPVRDLIALLPFALAE